MIAGWLTIQVIYKVFNPLGVLSRAVNFTTFWLQCISSAGDGQWAPCLTSQISQRVNLISLANCSPNLTSGGRADRRSSLNGRRCLWLSSPSQRQGSAYCRLHSSPSPRRACSREEEATRRPWVWTHMDAFQPRSWSCTKKYQNKERAGTRGGSSAFTHWMCEQEKWKNATTAKTHMAASDLCIMQEESRISSDQTKQGAGTAAMLAWRTLTEANIIKTLQVVHRDT